MVSLVKSVDMKSHPFQQIISSAYQILFTKPPLRNLAPHHIIAFTKLVDERMLGQGEEHAGTQGFQGI